MKPTSRRLARVADLIVRAEALRAEAAEVVGELRATLAATLETRAQLAPEHRTSLDRLTHVALAVSARPGGFVGRPVDQRDDPGARPAGDRSRPTGRYNVPGGQ